MLEVPENKLTNEALDSLHSLVHRRYLWPALGGYENQTA